MVLILHYIVINARFK